jgi:hypothetical protein
MLAEPPCGLLIIGLPPTPSKSNAFSLRFICNALNGYPFRLQLVYENIRMRPATPGSSRHRDPQRWTGASVYSPDNGNIDSWMDASQMLIYSPVAGIQKRDLCIRLCARGCASLYDESSTATSNDARSLYSMFDGHLYTCRASSSPESARRLYNNQGLQLCCK